MAKTKLQHFEERSRAAQQLKSLYEHIGNRDMTGFEVSEETRLSDAITLHDKHLERLLHEESAKFPAWAAPGDTGQVEQRGNRQDVWRSYGQRVLDALNSGSVNASVELPIEQRDDVLLTAGTATDGAEAVPVNTYASVWSYLTEASPVMQLASVIQTADGAPLKIPTAASFSSPALITEGATITRSAPQFSSVTLDGWKIGNLVQISTELESDNTADVMGHTIQQGTTALGNAVDTYLVTGSGTAQPNGIDNCTVGKTIASTSAITMDELIDTMHSVGSQYRTNGSWLLNDDTIAIVRKLKDTDNNYLWQQSNVMGQPDMLLGHPIYSEPNMAALDGTADAIVGTFGNYERGYAVRVAGGLRIERSVDFAFDIDAATIRMLIRVDGDIVDSAAIRSIKAAAA